MNAVSQTEWFPCTTFHKWNDANNNNNIIIIIMPIRIKSCYLQFDTRIHQWLHISQFNPILTNIQKITKIWINPKNYKNNKTKTYDHSWLHMISPTVG